MALLVPELPRQAGELLVGTWLVSPQSVQTHELERPRYRGFDFGLGLRAARLEQNPREGKLPLQLDVGLAAPGADTRERLADQVPRALPITEAEICLGQRDEATGLAFHAAPVIP